MTYKAEVWEIIYEWNTQLIKPPFCFNSMFYFILFEIKTNVYSTEIMMLKMFPCYYFRNKLHFKIYEVLLNILYLFKNLHFIFKSYYILSIILNCNNISHFLLY